MKQLIHSCIQGKFLTSINFRTCMLLIKQLEITGNPKLQDKALASPNVWEVHTNP